MIHAGQLGGRIGAHEVNIAYGSGRAAEKVGGIARTPFKRIQTATGMRYMV
jgi:hypothetical protein